MHLIHLIRQFMFILFLPKLYFWNWLWYFAYTTSVLYICINKCKLLSPSLSHSLTTFKYLKSHTFDDYSKSSDGTNFHLYLYTQMYLFVTFLLIFVLLSNSFPLQCSPEYNISAWQSRMFILTFLAQIWKWEPKTNPHERKWNEVSCKKRVTLTMSPFSNNLLFYFYSKLICDF